MMLKNSGEHVREVQQREHGSILSAEAYCQGPAIWAERGRQPGGVQSERYSSSAMNGPKAAKHHQIVVPSTRSLLSLAFVRYRSGISPIALPTVE